MTDSVHPTPDELADFHAELLSGADLERVRAHAADCADCTAELAALADVAIMLSEAGEETPAMPDDVAADLDQVLARAGRERAAGVSSLEAKRERASAPKPRRTPWVLIGGAAAAAVVVIGSIGLSGLDGMQSNDDSADAGGAADSGGDTLGELESGSPEAGADNGLQEDSTPPRLTPESVSTFASKLATKKGYLATNRSAIGCARNLPVPTNSSTAYADVRWEGRPAVLVVDTAARTASVFGCGTGAEPLYSTSY